MWEIFIRSGTTVFCTKVPDNAIKLYVRNKTFGQSLNQVSYFWSNSQVAIYLESLSSMVHFPFNHVKEFELSHNCVKRQVKAWGRFFLQLF